MDTHADAPRASSWGEHALLPPEFAAACRQAGVEPLHAQLLFNRGITDPLAMRRFLAARLDELPDPLALVDMPRAVARVERALARGERVTIVGDFDADGVTASALLTRVLRALGLPAERLSCFIPHRTYDARGLSTEALDVIAAVWDSTLVLTADCGSSDGDPVAYAREKLGIDVVITDHHQLPTTPPRAHALVNPWREDASPVGRCLCGAGIAFMLAWALLRAHGREAEAEAYLDLVAIGTIGDVASLLAENHTLARLGLARLNRTESVGLRALMRAARLAPGSVRERDVAYALAPRLNAAGRMQHASLAYRLLTTGDEGEAAALAAQLEGLNQLRRRRTEEVLALAHRQVQEQADEPVVLVKGESSDWPEGIIGLVAGKLAEECGRPAFVLSDGGGECRGSARGGAGYNLIGALAERADLFEAYGGHAQAAGFSIAATRIEELRAHLRAWAARGPQARAERLVDLWVSSPGDLCFELYGSLRLLAPFGAGNPEPVLRMNGATLTQRWSGARSTGVRLQINTLRFSGTCAPGVDRAAALQEGALVDVIFTLDLALRTPRGGGGLPGIWLQVLALEPAGPGEEAA
jgi:single-stranded-DNA-specific exonuclease